MTEGDSYKGPSMAYGMASIEYNQQTVGNHKRWLSFSSGAAPTDCCLG